MAFFEIHASAQSDIERALKEDRASAVKVLAIIQQIEADPDLQGRLLDREYSEECLAFMRWVEQYRQGNDLYRIKGWDPDDSQLIPYRIIYAYYPQQQNYVLLGIVPRGEFNYEQSNCYTQRILRDYQELL